MIRYSLRCDKGHGFEAWFRNGAIYDRQAKRGEIHCPECGSAGVSKAIMAPSIAKATQRNVEPAAAASESAPPPVPSDVPKTEPGDIHISGKVREALREMRRFIEQNAEYVGPRFADEARKIHKGEGKERSIYGEASDEEARALTDEGIEFGRIPWPKYRHDG